MIKTQNEMKEVKVVQDVICNKCGKSCLGSVLTISSSTVEEIDFPIVAQLNADWGYGSKKDGERHKSHLCESCYDEIVRSFLIEPLITNALLI
mgnify:CR=1 FL=1